MDKCGEQGLERAAECFYLAGSYEDAANIFESIERPEYAARCFCNLGMYVRAGMIASSVVIIQLLWFQSLAF